MLNSKHKPQILGSLAVLFLFVTAVGCKGFFVDPTLSSISLTAKSSSVVVGSTDQITATGTYDDNTTQTINGSVLWSVSGVDGSGTVATVASISDTGLLTGLIDGTATVTASKSGINSGNVSVTITLANLKSVAVTPAPSSMAVSTTLQFTATGTTTGGTMQNITDSVTWSSSDTSIATVNSATGLVTSTATPGTATITASATSNGTTFTGTSKLTTQ